MIQLIVRKTVCLILTKYSRSIVHRTKQRIKISTLNKKEKNVRGRKHVRISEVWELYRTCSANKDKGPRKRFKKKKQRLGKSINATT